MSGNRQDIRIVVFSSKTDTHCKKILSIAHGFSHNSQIAHCRGMADFSLAVRDMLFGYGVLLIMTRDTNELDEILRMSSRLKDHSIILILDNSLNDLTHRALKLYPRYTSYIKKDYEDVVLVLEKMMPKIKNTVEGGQHVNSR